MSTEQTAGSREGAGLFRTFVDLHAGALQSSGVPSVYWKSLHHKITNEIFDAGKVFRIVQIQRDGAKNNLVTPVQCKVVVTRDSGLQVSDPTSIFLVDHAWTYRVEHARQQLKQVPGLLNRMAALMGVNLHTKPPNPHPVELVLEHMWKYNQTYQLSQGSVEDKAPVWYIMDEFGTRVQHSEEPSCRMAPLFYVPGRLAYTVLWPLRDLQKGDEVTRDYAYGEANAVVRQCRLLPWIPVDLEGDDCVATEPPDSYYENIARENEEQLPVEIQPYTVPEGKILKVYTDVAQVRNKLTHPRFQLTDQEEEADIIWTCNRIKDYRKLSEERPRVMLNQFPCESVITVKDCLAAMARRVNGGPPPDWFRETFNLQTELPQFVKCYQERQQRRQNNLWLIKPCNSASRLDTHITKYLDFVIRQRETTPKVVCKYLEEPVLYHNIEMGLLKFDFRYMLLLRSLQPLRLYAYNIFWLRFANRPFSMDDFYDYEKHFTVMNNTEGIELQQMHHDDFISMFEVNYSDYSWQEIETDLFEAFRELFQAASSRPSPYGICPYPSSRAIYGVDVMLKWRTKEKSGRMMQPQILEVNFSPDYTRACLYNQSFYNHVFQTLFLDQPEQCPVTRVA